jgi:hypothetical protein
MTQRRQIKTRANKPKRPPPRGSNRLTQLRQDVILEEGDDESSRQPSVLPASPDDAATTASDASAMQRGIKLANLGANPLGIRSDDSLTVDDLFGTSFSAGGSTSQSPQPSPTTDPVATSDTKTTVAPADTFRSRRASDRKSGARETPRGRRRGSALPHSPRRGSTGEISPSPTTVSQSSSVRSSLRSSHITMTPLSENGRSRSRSRSRARSRSPEQIPEPTTPSPMGRSRSPSTRAMSPTTPRHANLTSARREMRSKSPSPLPRKDTRYKSPSVSQRRDVQSKSPSVSQRKDMRSKSPSPPPRKNMRSKSPSLSQRKDPRSKSPSTSQRKDPRSNSRSPVPRKDLRSKSPSPPPRKDMRSKSPGVSPRKAPMGSPRKDMRSKSPSSIRKDMRSRSPGSPRKDMRSKSPGPQRKGSRKDVRSKSPGSPRSVRKQARSQSLGKTNPRNENRPQRRPTTSALSPDSTSSRLSQGSEKQSPPSTNEPGRVGPTRGRKVGLEESPAGSRNKSVGRRKATATDANESSASLADGRSNPTRSQKPRDGTMRSSVSDLDALQEGASPDKSDNEGSPASKSDPRGRRPARRSMSSDDLPLGNRSRSKRAKSQVRSSDEHGSLSGGTDHSAMSQSFSALSPALDRSGNEVSSGIRNEPRSRQSTRRSVSSDDLPMGTGSPACRNNPRGRQTTRRSVSSDDLPVGSRSRSKRAKSRSRPCTESSISGTDHSGMSQSFSALSKRRSSRGLTGSRHSVESASLSGDTDHSVMSHSCSALSQHSATSQTDRRRRPVSRGRAKGSQETGHRRSLSTGPPSARSRSLSRPRERSKTPSRGHRVEPENLQPRKGGVRGKTPTRSRRTNDEATTALKANGSLSRAEELAARRMKRITPSTPIATTKPSVGMARVKEMQKKKTRSSSAPRPGRDTGKDLGSNSGRGASRNSDGGPKRRPVPKNRTEQWHTSFSGNLEELANLRKPKTVFEVDDDGGSLAQSVQTWDPSNATSRTVKRKPRSTPATSSESSADEGGPIAVARQPRSERRRIPRR